MNKMKRKTSQKPRKINIRGDLINSSQLPFDYIKNNYSFPHSLGNPDEETKVALDSAIAPVLTMLQSSFSGCNEGLLPRFLGYGFLIALSQDGLIRAGIEMLADEMTGKWIKLNRQGSKDLNNDGIPDIEEELKKYNAQFIFRQAVAMCGYFGGCLVFVDTGEEPESLINPLPLTPETFKSGSLKGLRVIEPYNISPGVYNSAAPWQKDYYKPSCWYVQGLPIHSSRFLYFSMNDLPAILLPAYNFFGIPLAQTVLDAVTHFTECREAAARLLTKFSLTIFKTNMDEILSGGAATMLDRRVQYMVQNRTNDGIIAIDKGTEEDIINISTPLSGVTDIVRQSMEMVATYFNEPVTKMWGISPAGFNATGESDMQNHRDHVASSQEKILLHPLRKLIKILQLNRFGEIDDSVDFVFEKLSEDDESKAATTQKTKAETGQLLIDGGVISPEEERKRIIADPQSGYNDIDPYAMPELPDEDFAEKDVQETPTLASDAEFNEGDHPRDDDGKFSDGAGGNSSKKNTEKPLKLKKQNGKIKITGDVKVNVIGEGYYSLMQGSEITNMYTFAGKGSKKPLRVAEHLSKQYGGNPEDWSHTRGKGLVNYKGVNQKADIHWFECQTIGIVKLKVKEWYE